MHDLNTKNVTDDPLKIPGQLDEVLPLTPVQIFVKEEELLQVHNQISEVVPLSPVQIFLKEEEGVYCKAEEPELVSLVPLLPKEEHVVYCKSEEPELVSLVPLLPKEEHVVDELPDDFEEGSGQLIINLENSSSEEWSNHSDPLAIGQNEASASYVEYVETGEPILMDLGATTSTEGSSQLLRIAHEAGSTVENGELYDLMGSEEIVPVPENDGVSPDGNTDDECVEITDVPRAPPKVFHCGYCGEAFPTEGGMQVHTLSHADRAAFWRDLPEAKPKLKPVRTLRAQHSCGDCGESFDRLDLLMRHRLGHIRAALRKPFSAPKPFGVPQPLGVPKRSAELRPQLQSQVSAAPDSRRAVAPVSTNTSPKRSHQRAVATSQPKKWGRQKKTRRRRVS